MMKAFKEDIEGFDFLIRLEEERVSLNRNDGRDYVNAVLSQILEHERSERVKDILELKEILDRQYHRLTGKQGVKNANLSTKM